MKFISRYANSGIHKVHYLDSVIDTNDFTSLVYIPGALNYAEQAIDLLSRLKQRRCIAMSLRGRGNSDAPTTGYALENHVEDIAAVVEESNIKQYCLMAYSMGVPYAIKYATGSSNVKGLILCDYPAKYPSIPDSWSDRVLHAGFISEEKKHVVLGIQKESIQTELYPELLLLDIPVLIIKGGAEGSLLNMSEVEKYSEHLKNVTIIEIEESGHELWIPDKQKFVEIVEEFLRRLDVSDASGE